MSYIHKEDTHNLNAPREIVPVINAMVQPESVIDIGCGVGTFLCVFKELGVKDVKGIDGEWVNTDLLRKYLHADEFQKANLSEYIEVERKYDLAICLEVAEHIEEKYSDNLIRTLVNASDVILFSAAIPFQSGQFHVNEQWHSYWKEKFSKYGYVLVDNIRSKFWDSSMTEFWYKQNMFFAVSKDAVPTHSLLHETCANTGFDVVHPDMYLKKAKALHAIETGRKSVGYYLKLLAKSFLSKI